MDTDTPTSDTPWSSEEDAGRGPAIAVAAGGSAAAAIDLDAGAGAPELPTPVVVSGSGRKRKSTSKVWQDFDQLFTMRNGKRVRVLEERRRRLTSDMVEVLSCLKDWELADAQLQHNVEKETKDLELAFENMYLDDDAVAAQG
ncbi:unnamed protein product [Urochloa humidicola]